MHSPSLAQKLQHLQSNLREIGSALVCFSGGVDSSLLLKVAVDEIGENALAFTAESPSLPQRELAEAKALAETIGARHLIGKTDEMTRPEYRANPTNRCYFCKTALMTAATHAAATRNLRYILLGTNHDELGGHRPGLRAANEEGARHPLAEAGLTKADVRELSQSFGLKTWDKPQLACLASRFPYGTAISSERLKRIEQFEDDLYALGFSGLRVRFHDQVARIELSPDQLLKAMESEIRSQIVATGKRLGFAYTTLDLAGYRTGAMNETLDDAERLPDQEAVRQSLQHGDGGSANETRGP